MPQSEMEALMQLQKETIESLRQLVVYSGENVPLFRRNGYRCSGGTIPKVRNSGYRFNELPHASLLA